MPESREGSSAGVTVRTLDRRRFLLGCATFLAAAGLGGVSLVHAAQMPQKPTAQSRPNILFMLADNVGYGVLSSYNGGISDTPTPRIDSLGAEGLRLTNFNVENQCTPSRAAIMTGRLPIRSGIGKACSGRHFRQHRGALGQRERTVTALDGDAVVDDR